MWINRERVPRFYPNAQTLTAPGARQVGLIRELIVQLPSAWAVKDSFASLDLAPLGFTLLFDAQWIVLPQEKASMLESGELRWEIVRSEDFLAEWERAWCDANGDTNTARVFLPVLLEKADVAIVAGFRGDRIVAGAIGNRSEEVVGWSNFFAGHGVDTRTCASGSIAALARFFPDAAMVGYEEGDMLRLARSLGFESLGPLRVWLFDGPE